MRKIVFLATIFLLIGSSSFGQSDLNRMNLCGKVKKIKEVSIETKSYYQDMTCHLFVIFDEKGNKTLDVNYNQEGKIVKNNQYQYDSAGNLITSLHYDPDGLLYSSLTFKYENNILIEKNITYYQDGAPMKYKFRYDQKGNLIEEIDYDGHGNLFKGWQYSYNKNDQVTEERFYLPYGCLYEKAKFEYDLHGNLIKEQHFDMEGKLYRELHFAYDKEGYLVEESKTQYRGRLFCTETFSYQYQFDHNGNWVNKKVNTNNNYSHTVVREIEYY